MITTDETKASEEQGRILRWAVYEGQERWSIWFCDKERAEAERKSLEREMVGKHSFRVDYAPKNPINPPLSKPRKRDEMLEGEAADKPLNRRYETRKERLARLYGLQVAKHETSGEGVA